MLLNIPWKWSASLKRPISRTRHYTYLLSRPILSLNLSCIWIIIQMNGFQWMRLVSRNAFKLAPVQGHRDSVLCVHLKEYAYISALSCIGKATNNTDICLSVWVVVTERKRLAAIYSWLLFFISESKNKSTVDFSIVNFTLDQANDLTHFYGTV